MNLHFAAYTQTGASRGKDLGAPTINLRIEDVPSTLKEGIYVCRAGIDEDSLMDAVMHYGPKPVYHEGPSCEVHMLDTSLERPDVLFVEVLDYLREVQDFKSEADLVRQIQQDIEKARGILNA